MRMAFGRGATVIQLKEGERRGGAKKDAVSGNGNQASNSKGGFKSTVGGTLIGVM